jgi:myo-inositol 2-dehydrogenase/D-chiro-inositol 1-dehydrogenase
MTTRKLRVALVGCGNFTNAALLPSIRLAPIDVVATCDLDRARAEATGKAIGAIGIYTDYDAMLAAEKLDVVMMAIGPNVYPALARKAFERGIHVYLQKPPALSAADARALKAEADKHGKQLIVGFMKRFGTAYRMAKEIVTTPEFGGITHISARLRSGPYLPVWSKTASAMAFVFDHSVHYLDLLRFYGGPIREVVALPSPELDGRVGFAVTLRFESGATGLLEISNYETRGVPNEHIEILGPGRCVIVDNVSRLSYFRGAKPMERGRTLALNEETLVWEPNVTVISQENASFAHLGFLGEMRNLADTLLAGGHVQPDIGEGIASLVFAEAILNSEGRLVRLDD